MAHTPIGARKKRFKIIIMSQLKEKIINLINELKQISVKELVEIRKEKYLNITSDI